MEIARINELKKELAHCSQDQLVAICLRLARHKKETKELLNYLLFESVNEGAYINAIKEELKEDFSEVNITNLYRAKLRIRKILRQLNKYIRFSGIKKTEVELRLFFCQLIIDSGLKIRKSRALFNLFYRQVEATQKAFNALHEDLQLDYQIEMDDLRSEVESTY